jgi:ribosomal-protein-alanine N-acetyltransferase
MGAAPELRTERLLLRRWTDADREPFAALNADRRVMEHFPAPYTREESDALVDRVEEQFERLGFGLWVVEVPDRGFIGFTGFLVPRFHVDWMDAREQPVVEIGWRLAYDAWHRGYASEAARACLDLAFDELGRREVVSFTTVGNVRSQAVMERIGMTRLTTYDHPIPGGAFLPSVAYLVTAEQHWRHGAGPGT